MTETPLRDSPHPGGWSYYVIINKQHWVAYSSIEPCVARDVQAPYWPTQIPQLWTIRASLNVRHYSGRLVH